MDLDIKHTNLLDLRKSEKMRLAAKLNGAALSDIDSLWDAIGNTLSRFLIVSSENEEQIYFFGLAMRSLLPVSERGSIRLRDHQNQEVKIVFAGGFLGWSLSTTLDALRADRKKRGHEQIVKGKLVKDIEAVVASIVPTDRH